MTAAGGRASVPGAGQSGRRCRTHLRAAPPEGRGEETVGFTSSSSLHWLRAGPGHQLLDVPRPIQWMEQLLSARRTCILPTDGTPGLANPMISYLSPDSANVKFSFSFPMPGASPQTLSCLTCEKVCHPDPCSSTSGSPHGPSTFLPRACSDDRRWDGQGWKPGLPVTSPT